jgi:excisionase family DNA binding protein
MMKLIERSEVASLLGVSLRTVDRLRSSGELRAIRIRGSIRFAAQDVEAYVASKRQAGGRP